MSKRDDFDRFNRPSVNPETMRKAMAAANARLRELEQERRAKQDGRDPDGVRPDDRARRAEGQLEDGGRAHADPPFMVFPRTKKTESDEADRWHLGWRLVWLLIASALVALPWLAVWAF